MTLEKIRAALPTHIMLTPGTPLRKGDETLEFERGSYGEWEADIYPEGHGVGGFTHARRQIPPHILDNQAFWLLLDKGFEAPDHFADKAENLGIVKKLGGLDNYRKQRKVGRLYDKWLLEQMEDV